MKLLSILFAFSMLLTADAATAQTPPKPTTATPDNSAPFLGEWTISAKGSYGDLTVTLTLKPAEGKVVGEAVDTNGKHPLLDVSKSGVSLVVSYVFDYQGMPIDAVITLTPGEKTIDASLDFANGAAQCVGTAAKK
jgi:hypothetical protein